MPNEILFLDESKKVSGTIPIKNLKMAANEWATKCFNDSIIHGSKFSYKRSLADIILAYNHGNSIKVIIDQLVCCQQYLRFLRRS